MPSASARREWRTAATITPPRWSCCGPAFPVLGEKPISNRIAEASEMVALAAEMGIPYGINLNHRFTPAARRAREWLDEGRVGEVNICNMTMWINNPNESSPHFHMRALHPHSIDVMRYFCGDVDEGPGLLAKRARAGRSGPTCRPTCCSARAPSAT